MNVELDNKIQIASKLRENCYAEFKAAKRRLAYADAILEGLKEQERRETEAALIERSEALGHADCEAGHCLEKNGKGDCNPNAGVKQAYPNGRWTQPAKI